MILSRAKPAIQTPKEGESGGPSSASKKQLPKLEEFLSPRYVSVIHSFYGLL